MKDRLTEAGSRLASAAVSGARKNWDKELGEKGYTTALEAKEQAEEAAASAVAKAVAEIESKQRVIDILSEFGIPKFSKDGTVTPEFLKAKADLEAKGESIDLDTAMSTDKGMRGLLLSMGHRTGGSDPGAPEGGGEKGNGAVPVREGLPAFDVLEDAVRKGYMKKTTLQSLMDEEHSVNEDDKIELERVGIMIDAGRL